GMRLVPQQFFPSSDRPELLVDLQLPEKASIYATKDVSVRLDKLLRSDPDVDHWSTYVGQGAVRFYLPLNVQLPNDFFGQAVVVQEQAFPLGLSSQQLALSLNPVVSGVTATQVRSGIYLVDVLVRASAEHRMSLSTIRTLQVPLPSGRTIPLSQIASVEYGQE